MDAPGDGKSGTTEASNGELLFESARKQSCRRSVLLTAPRRERNNEIIFGRTRRRDDGQKLRGHSRGHFPKFSTPLGVGTSTNCNRLGQATCQPVAAAHTDDSPKLRAFSA